MGWGTFERAVGTGILRIGGVFFVGVALAALVVPRQPVQPFDRVAVTVCFTVLTTLLVALRRGSGFWRRLLAGDTWRRLRTAPPRFAAILIAVVGGAACTVCAMALRYAVGWDVRLVATMAQELTHGQVLNGYEHAYISRYPNNLALLAVDRLCESIGPATGLPASMIFILLNGACLAVTLYATYSLVTMLRGTRTALVAELLVLGLLGLSPWMAVPYTDLIGVTFPVLATVSFVAAVRARSRRRQIVLVVVASLALVAGFEMKATEAVGVVAFAVVAVLALVGRRGQARLLVAVALVGGLLLSAGGVFLANRALPAAAGVPAAQIDRSRTPTLPWWFYMGTTQQKLPHGVDYGGYDAKFVHATYYLNGAGAGAYAVRQLKRRMAALGPIGYAQFLAKKAAWTWGDGMFTAWSEGNDASARIFGGNPLTSFVRPWNHPGGALYSWRGALTQASWILLLLVLGLRLLWAGWRWDIGLLAVTVLGIAVFTLAFQGHARYLIVYLPLVVALAVALPPTPITRKLNLNAGLPGNQPGDAVDGRRSDAGTVASASRYSMPHHGTYMAVNRATS